MAKINGQNGLAAVGGVQGKVVVAMADDACRRALSQYLETEDYEVRAVESTEALMEMFHAWPADVIACEHRLPKVDVVAGCAAIRQISLVPVVGLLPQGSETRVAQVLNAGADACIALPCDPEDILSQLKAVMRRFTRLQADETLIEVGDFRVVAETRRCVVAGREVRLSSQPFKLLLHMLRKQKRVFKHEELCRVLWASSPSMNVEFLRPVMMELRAKIEADRRNPVYLLTEYGVGYRFNPFGAAADATTTDAGGPLRKSA